MIWTFEEARGRDEGWFGGSVLVVGKTKVDDQETGR